MNENYRHGAESMASLITENWNPLIDCLKSIGTARSLKFLGFTNEEV